MIRKRTSIRKTTLCVEQLESRLCPSTYSVVDLGTLGGTSSVAEDINVSGQVVGQAATSGNLTQHAFLWQNPRMTDLGTLGGQNSDANALNNFTQVVGQADTGALDTSGHAIVHAFLWQTGAMTDLGTLGGPDSEAFDINTSGQAVGRSDTGAVDANGFKVQHAFAWQNGVMTDLNNQLPANSGWVLWWSSGINDNGQIAGVGSHNGLQRAFLLSSGVINDLGTLGATSTNNASRAHGINNSGQVVGLSSTNNNQGRGFLYSGGVMTELGALTGGSSSGSEAFAINSSAQVVGQSYFVQNGGILGGTHVVLWQNGTKTDLNKLIPSNSGWVLSKAFGINDTGRIVGWGSINNQTHAFLAIPGSPLSASVGPTHGAATATSITVSQVQPLLSEAIARWAATGVNTSMLSNIQVTIADLPGRELGFASGHTITLDGNAAGWGWFVDPTPKGDSEFTTRGNQGEKHRMDLLSVLEHELGHVLGFEHQETGVMEDTLTTGTRRVPSDGIDTATRDSTAETSSWPFSTRTGKRFGQEAAALARNTIADDEPRISISDVTKAEGKKGQTTLFTFTVTLSAAYDQAVTMSFRTVDGTAKTSDGDYVARTGTLTFAPGETTKTITIEVKGDSKREADEYFYLDLFGNGGNSLFAKNRGLGTILNDD